jgi:hypothetical protein
MIGFHLVDHTPEFLGESTVGLGTYIGLHFCIGLIIGPLFQIDVSKFHVDLGRNGRAEGLSPY